MKYGELSHVNHPQHKLRFEYSELPFKCDGCREVGIGSRFKCSPCDFDLHTHCATPIPSATVHRHPFYPKCIFHFLLRPPGNIPRYCNGCGRCVAGFVYHCLACGFDLHPCCASLPHVLQADGGLRLYLQSRATAPCHRCGRKGRSWSYRSECKTYDLHVACATEMLVESWHELYYGVGGDSGRGKKSISTGNRIPAIRGAGAIHRRSGKGKVKRCCELAAMALQFVISAVLGDPTALIAGVVASLIFRR